jgi:hypothetical protein
VAFRIRVQLKDAEDVFSPRMTREAAEADIREINRVLSSSPRQAMLGVPNLSWLSAMGQNIRTSSVPIS